MYNLDSVYSFTNKCYVSNIPHIPPSVGLGLSSTKCLLSNSNAHASLLSSSSSIPACIATQGTCPPLLLALVEARQDM